MKENKKEAIEKLQQLLKENYDNKEFRVDVIYEKSTSNMATVAQKERKGKEGDHAY